MKIAYLALVVFTLSFATVAEARIGSGRSMGNRGFRGFAPRTAPAQPYRGSGFQQQPQQAPLRGGFMSGLAGGIAGGFLGSMLFRSLGYAGAGMPEGGGGLGMIEILLFAALGYFGFRWFMARKASSAAQPMTAVPEGEPELASALMRFDSNFDLERFKDDRMEDFLDLQNSWSKRDISVLESRLAPELRQLLEGDLDALRSAGRINRIENVAVKGTELVEAWQEYDKEFATLRFRANLLDYTIDEKTEAVVAGDRTQPVRFEENWTFVRPARSMEAWRLSAIQ